MRKRDLVFLSIFFGFLLVFATQYSARADTNYAGTETCKDCHKDYYNKFIKSVHGKKAVPGNPANREGCESCHGPGAQHVEKEGGKGTIFAFARKTDPNAKDSMCLGCHEASRDLPFWDMSKHKSAMVACTDCHSIHSPVPAKGLLTVQEPDLCYGCHKNIRAQANKQSHHPIREGKMKCSNCHNTMGTSNPKAMIKADSVNDLCYKCHAEKRGPYAFEHMPVPENCLSCHEIHGSNHGRLLVRKVPLLCQSCHNEGSHPIRPYTNLSSFRGPATTGKNRFFSRSCLNCHGNIHGSSLSASFER